MHKQREHGEHCNTACSAKTEKSQACRHDQCFHGGTSLKQLKHKGETFRGEIRFVSPRTTKRPPIRTTTAQQVNPGNHREGRVGQVSGGLPGMTVSQPDWLASPI